MTDAMFRQEYLAQFIKDANAVFKTEKLDGCELDNITLLPPEQGHYYVVGADLAKHKDYTVLTVIDRQTKRLVYIERFTRTDWVSQKQRITAVAKLYNNEVVSMDATGVGDPICDDLVDAGIRVLPFKISGHDLKRMLIEKLAVTIENRRISWPKPSRRTAAVRFVTAFVVGGWPSGVSSLHSDFGGRRRNTLADEINHALKAGEQLAIVVCALEFREIDVGIVASQRPRRPIAQDGRFHGTVGGPECIRDPLVDDDGLKHAGFASGPMDTAQS